MTTRPFLPSLAVALLVLGAVPTSFAEAKVSCDTLPAAVLTRAKAEADGATIHGCVKDKENGTPTYEVETLKDGKSKDMTFNSAGGLMEVEQEVDRASLPHAVAAAITKAASGGEIGKIESVTRGATIMSYETTIRRNGKRQEVAFSPEGNRMKAD